MEPLGPDDPRQVGGYRLLRRLGAGGMGRVYLGRTGGGRTVAVKVVRSDLADDQEFRARFRQEVAAARRVGGAWTAPVLDADTEGPRPWVATGYVAGPALDAAVKGGGPLPEYAVRALGAGLAEALTAVHTTGLVHRDVKPSNVLLALDGPRLIDFGIARALDAATSLTRSGYVVGSPGYMSPEQANGDEAGPASDVFSLGAVLAYAATGTPPFGDGVSAAVLLYRVLHEQPDLATLDGPLREVVAACLAKTAADRPTPGRLRELLADGGETARLMGDRWLPPALAAAVGRRAVELLDLESEPAPGPAPAPGFALDPGPAGSGTGSGSLPGLSPATGSFGPPPQGRWLPAEATAPVQPPEDAPPAAPAPGTPPARRRPRRALVLATAGVLLVAGGTAAVLALLPGHTGQQRPGGGTAGAVPTGFLGHWQGQITTKVVPLTSTFELTVRQGKVGGVVTETRNHSHLESGYCAGRGKLLRVTADTIVVREEPTGGTLACTDIPETQTYTLNQDGSVHVEITGDGSDPSGDLAKQD